MTEIREVLARAMRAQGKADPAEVFAEADALNQDEPTEPEWATEHEQASLLDALLEDDPDWREGTGDHGE